MTEKQQFQAELLKVIQDSIVIPGDETEPKAKETKSKRPWVVLIYPPDE